MKQSREMEKLESMLRSSQLVAGGFLGDDSRNVSEVIEADRLALEKAGVLDDTVIMISSDHGESQGELNVWGDHQTADNITCRINHFN